LDQENVEPNEDDHGDEIPSDENADDRRRPSKKAKEAEKNKGCCGGCKLPPKVNDASNKCE